VTIDTRRPDTATTPAVDAWALLQEFLISFKSYAQGLANELDLAPQQMWALMKLGEPIAMGELANALVCDSSSITGLVDRLEQRGLVERRPAAHDRRVKLIVLTERGAAVREAIMVRFAEPPPALAGLSLESQIALRDVLREALALPQASA
jgi:MarR family transcriptional regulator, organic hydroperoxide resistance regulator